MTETSLLKGKGNLTLTGSLGDVMQESARAAVSYVRSRAEMYDADPNFHEKFDIHIHVPEGAIPKDGPSAGITMAVSLFSAVTKIPVLKDVAMTGEITLRGKVLPVGGIKDKILAAYRAGIRTIILSAENDKDLDDLPEEIRSEMEFHLVNTMDEVIKIAMEGAPPRRHRRSSRRPSPPRGASSRTEAPRKSLDRRVRHRSLKPSRPPARARSRSRPRHPPSITQQEDTQMARRKGHQRLRRRDARSRPRRGFPDTTGEEVARSSTATRSTSGRSTRSRSRSS